MSNRVSADHLYLLRSQMLKAERQAIEAQHRALEAQQANLEVKLCILDLEKEYGLLATDSTLNVQTGEIAEKEEIAKTGGEDGVLHQLHDWNQNGRDI